MPLDPKALPTGDPFPIGNRYSAAWVEHGTRITQRQAVMQMYLTAAGVVYGYWLTNRGKPEIDIFLAIAITLLTVCSSALIWMHNRVLQHLTTFMKNCEKCASRSIEAHGGSINLFYFYNKASGEVDAFHRKQRWYQRIVLYSILTATNGLAIVLTWESLGAILSTICAALLAVAIAVPLFDSRADRGDS